jgi:hypothetical protein
MSKLGDKRVVKKFCFGKTIRGDKRWGKQVIVQRYSLRTHADEFGVMQYGCWCDYMWGDDYFIEGLVMS